MSRAEEITSEVRRLVLTCRAMETQLQQSLPKKTHQEVVTKMQGSIDSLNEEVNRLRSELQNTKTLNESISGLGSTLTSSSETISSLAQTVANLNQLIEAQKTTIQELSTRLSQNTVPSQLYDQTITKLGEMQSKMESMVDKSEMVSLQTKVNEQTDVMKSMVPRGEYLALQAQFANFVPKDTFDALQKTLNQYVPREQLIASETRLHELESKLESYVPRADYEELTARIGLLTKEASSLGVEVVPPMEEMGNTQTEMVAPVVASGDSIPTKEQSADKSLVPPRAGTPESEITEIQAQMSEIKGSEDSGITSIPEKPVKATQGFVFENTTFCATSGLEFLKDLERAPIESIQNHMKSGDFERWFKDVLADDSSAQALRTIREGNSVGDELRSKMVAVISPRYRTK